VPITLSDILTFEISFFAKQNSLNFQKPQSISEDQRAKSAKSSAINFQLVPFLFEGRGRFINWRNLHQTLKIGKPQQNRIRQETIGISIEKVTVSSKNEMLFNATVC
jgi:hypothetical protein